MDVKVGSRLRSVVCDTEAIIVRVASGDADIRCGGHPMVAKGEDAPSAELADGFADGTTVGKRYADDDAGIELLVTKAGKGSLSIGDRPLPVKDPKALPSSD